MSAPIEPKVKQISSLGGDAGAVDGRDALPGVQLLQAELKSTLMSLPVTSVVLELGAARVLLSPASTLTDEQLRGCGAVTDIVAPSLMHTAGMKAAAAAHPGARLWGPQGIRGRQPDLTWHGELGVDPWPYEAELALMPLPGAPKMNEAAFLHRASQTLVLTDMVFNIDRPKGLLAWLFFRMFGTYRRFAVSKLFMTMVKDRKAFRAAVAHIAEQDFEHVVMAHGVPVMADGKSRLLAAFRERGLLD